jgi:hypothetical protein
MLQCTGELFEELKKVDFKRWFEWETVEPIAREIVRKYRVLKPESPAKASPEYKDSPQRLENKNLRRGANAIGSGK